MGIRREEKEETKSSGWERQTLATGGRGFGAKTLWMATAKEFSAMASSHLKPGRDLGAGDRKR